MNPQTVTALGQNAIQLTLMVAAPLLLAALVVGLIVSVFQAATQINEMTLSFIPKLVAIFVALLISGPWILTMLTDYMRGLITSIPTLIG
jgi:flagellar biosynthetic protein FliQ